MAIGFGNIGFGNYWPSANIHEYAVGEHGEIYHWGLLMSQAACTSVYNHQAGPYPIECNVTIRLNTVSEFAMPTTSNHLKDDAACALVEMCLQLDRENTMLRAKLKELTNGRI